MKLITPALLALTLSACGTTDQDWGGYVHEYALKAEMQRGTLHEIPRICFSACTIWADQMGHWACLGPKSQLGFHQMYEPRTGFSRPPYSPTLDAALPNPLPRKSGWWMDRQTALQFWPECPAADHRR